MVDRANKASTATPSATAVEGAADSLAGPTLDDGTELLAVAQDAVTNDATTTNARRLLTRVSALHRLVGHQVRRMWFVKVLENLR